MVCLHGPGCLGGLGGLSKGSRVVWALFGPYGCVSLTKSAFFNLLPVGQPWAMFENPASSGSKYHARQRPRGGFAGLSASICKHLVGHFQVRLGLLVVKLK